MTGVGVQYLREGLPLPGVCWSGGKQPNQGQWSGKNSSPRVVESGWASAVPEVCWDMCMHSLS